MSQHPTEEAVASCDLGSSSTTRARNGRLIGPPDKLGDYHSGPIVGISSDEEDQNAHAERKEDLPKSSRASKGRKSRSDDKKVDEHETELKKKFRGHMERSQKTMLKLWDRNANELISKIESLEQKVQRQDGEMRKMKIAVLSRMQETGSVVETNDVVEETWRQAMSDVKGWAKKYSIQESLSSLNDSAKSEIVRVLTSSPYPLASGTTIYETFKSGVSAATIVNAIFNKHVVDFLFGQPAFFLQNVRGVGSAADLSKAIGDLFQLGDQVNPDLAKTWYTVTMKMLHPKDGKWQTNFVTEGKTLQDSKQDQYLRCQKSLITCLKKSNLVMQMSSEAEYERLQRADSIIGNIGEYLIKLSTRKEFMKVLSYEQLKSSNFKHDSDLMKPHGSQLLGDDEIFRDKKLVSLVVSPAIVAYGDREGKNFDNYRVWQKAVVMVSRDDFRIEGADSENIAGTASRCDPPKTGEQAFSTSMGDNSDSNSHALTRKSRDDNRAALMPNQTQTDVRAGAPVIQGENQPGFATSEAADNNLENITCYSEAALKKRSIGDTAIRQHLKSNDDGSSGLRSRYLPGSFNPHGTKNTQKTMNISSSGAEGSRPSILKYEENGQRSASRPLSSRNSVSETNKSAPAVTSPKRAREGTASSQISPKKIKLEHLDDDEVEIILQDTLTGMFTSNESRSDTQQAAKSPATDTGFHQPEQSRPEKVSEEASAETEKAAFSSSNSSESKSDRREEGQAVKTPEIGAQQVEEEAAFSPLESLETKTDHGQTGNQPSDEHPGATPETGIDITDDDQ